MPTPDPLASLSPEERAIMAEFIPMLVGRAANRRERMLLFLDLMKKLDGEQSWLWTAMCARQNRKGRMTLIVVNGRLSDIELTTAI